MKERPILFSGPMVRSILEARKTQTRRVIRNPEKYDNIRGCDFCCPHGQAGDKLWVRETWCAGCLELDETVCYKADFGRIFPPCKQGVVKPSIFLPRKYSRITLEITGVRIERLQGISEEDGEAEGMTPNYFENGSFQTYPSGKLTPYKRAFAMTWERINGKTHPWESNPWVWAIEFQRVTA